MPGLPAGASARRVKQTFRPLRPRRIRSRAGGSKCARPSRVALPVLSSGVGVESCGKRRSLASACSFSIRILSRALCCVVSARRSVLEARVRRAGEGRPKASSKHPNEGACGPASRLESCATAALSPTTAASAQPSRIKSGGVVRGQEYVLRVAIAGCGNHLRLRTFISIAE